MAQRPAPNPRLYRNADYQFSVRLPSGYLACVGEETNHGVVILLDRHSRCDGPYDNSVRRISVYGAYNADGLGTTPAQIAAVECRWDHARHIVWLKRRLSGRQAAGCRSRFPDGHIEVTLLVLRKTNSNFSLNWIKIGVNLVTTPARYASDMRIFRWVVRGVWVHPDGPHY